MKVFWLRNAHRERSTPSMSASRPRNNLNEHFQKAFVNRLGGLEYGLVYAQVDQLQTAASRCAAAHLACWPACPPSCRLRLTATSPFLRHRGALSGSREDIAAPVTPDVQQVQRDSSHLGQITLSGTGKCSMQHDLCLQRTGASAAAECGQDSAAGSALGARCVIVEGFWYGACW